MCSKSSKVLKRLDQYSAHVLELLLVVVVEAVGAAAVVVVFS
jgi:hypothetical protein